MKTTSRIAALVSAALLSAASAFAAPITVVRWDGTDNPVSGNQGLTAGNNSTVVSSDYANPAQGASYYPNYETQGATPFFYAAGYRIYNGEQKALNIYRVTNATGNDEISFQTNEAGGVNAYVHAIVLWRKDDFLGSTAGGLDGMTISMASNATSPRARFVVQLDNGAYYASAAFGSGTGGGVGAFSGGFASTTWYNYDPTTDFSVIGSEATLAAADFENFKAAGFYTYTVRSGVDRYAQSNILNFTVTAIPEPGTVGLALGGLALMAIRRRRRG